MGNLEPRLQQGYVGGLVVCTQLYPVAREGPKGGKGSHASNIRGEPRISLGALSSDLYHQGLYATGRQNKAWSHIQIPAHLSFQLKK